MALQNEHCVYYPVIVHVVQWKCYWRGDNISDAQIYSLFDVLKKILKVNSNWNQTPTVWANLGRLRNNFCPAK
nr:hypothetical protein [Bacteroidota bacterium]